MVDVYVMANHHTRAVASRRFVHQSGGRWRRGVSKCNHKKLVLCSYAIIAQTDKKHARARTASIMGIRDLMNENFGWSRKISSITLIICGVFGPLFLIAGTTLIKMAIVGADEAIADIFQNRYTLHHKDHHRINMAILFSTRLEELINWMFMQILGIFIFFPPGFAFFVIFLVGATAYFVITRFSEDSSRAAEHANLPI